MAATLRVRFAALLIFALSTLAPLTARATAIADVSAGEINKYKQIYQLDIPNDAAFAAGVPYNIDNSGTVVLPEGFDRIAYYMELDNGSGREWVWVSMDAFTSDLSLIGVPNETSGILWQQTLSMMNIESNSPNVTAGTGITTGNIEFWPDNFATAQGLGGLGGSSSTYDWDDTISQATNGYGSMQVHNYGAGEVLFSFNRFHITGGDIGIGSRPTSNPDWLFSANDATYTLKSIEVWVQEIVPVPEPSSFLLLGLGALGLIRHTRRRRRRA